MGSHLGLQRNQYIRAHLGYPLSAPSLRRTCPFRLPVTRREEMAEAASNKRLHCGHVFHLHCLRWVSRYAGVGPRAHVLVRSSKTVPKSAVHYATWSSIDVCLPAFAQVVAGAATELPHLPRVRLPAACQRPSSGGGGRCGRRRRRGRAPWAASSGGGACR